MKKVAILIMALMVSGCATNYATQSPEKVRDAVKVVDSEFNSSIQIVGPDMRSSTQRGLFTDNEKVKIRTLVDREKSERAHRVDVSVLYSGDWRFYEVVNFIGGESQDLEVADRSVHACQSIGCTYSERVGFFLTDKQIQSIDDDFKFALRSKSGHENVLVVPINYVEGYRQALAD